MSIFKDGLAGLALALAIAGAACAAEAPAPVAAAGGVTWKAPVPLYPGVAPGSEGATQAELITPGPGNRIIRNVTRPELTVYMPPPGAANGVGMIVAPGGGFHILSYDSEGTAVAEWLAAHGVTAFLLKYRLDETSPNQALATMQMMKYLGQIKTSPGGFPPVTEGERQADADAARAMVLVRSHAGDWGVDPHRLGFIGFSAGALLAMSVSTSADPAVRPDFTASIYGALRPGLVPPSDAPPLFIAAATDDALLPGRSLPIYQAWVAAHRPVEMHLFDRGNHGFGMDHHGTTSDRWIHEFGWWLEEHGWIARGPAK
jgi:acetyl esterase/lipase